MPEAPSQEVAADAAPATSREAAMVSGLVLWGFLCFIPLWSASLMERNPVFLHFYGQRIPCGIVLTCVSVLLAYILSIWGFYRFARKGAVTERNLLLIGSSYVTLLGALFLVISFPMETKAGGVTDDIINNCEHGIPSEEFTQADRALRKLKRTPECERLNNIEDCKSFRASYSAYMLRRMEEDMHCSGWCLPPDTKGYPRTIFSSADFEVTCDGAVSRTLQTWVLDLSSEFFYEGIYLLIMAVTIGVLQMFRVLHEDFMYSIKVLEHRKLSYGATEALPYSAPPPPRPE